MKILKILVIPCIIFNCGSGLIKAQIPQKMNQQSITGIKSVSLGNLDTTFNLENTSGLYGLSGSVSALKDMTVKPIFCITTTSGNIYNLTNKPFLFNDIGPSLTWKPITIAGYTIDTYNGIWYSLDNKPSFASSRNIYDLTNNHIWTNDTFWNSLLRNTYLFLNHRK
jgi:hypothetical protein